MMAFSVTRTNDYILMLRMTYVYKRNRIRNYNEQLKNEKWAYI